MNKEQFEAQSSDNRKHGLGHLWGDLDPGIETVVNLLRANGVETFQSCQGGQGHSFPEPTVQFHGSDGAGWQALSVAINYAMPVLALRRSWSIQDGLPVGPHWEMTFIAPKLSEFNASWKSTPAKSATRKTARQTKKDADEDN